jgi:hypothetical protein
MGFAQLNPSYRVTTERIQNAARPARIAYLINAASGRCRWEFAARTSPLDVTAGHVVDVSARLADEEEPGGDVPERQ